MVSICMRRKGFSDSTVGSFTSVRLALLARACLCTTSWAPCQARVSRQLGRATAVSVNFSNSYRARWPTVPSVQCLGSALLCHALCSHAGLVGQAVAKLLLCIRHCFLSRGLFQMRADHFANILPGLVKPILEFTFTLHRHCLVSTKKVFREAPAAWAVSAHRCQGNAVPLVSQPERRQEREKRARARERERVRGARRASRPVYGAAVRRKRPEHAVRRKRQSQTARDRQTDRQTETDGQTGRQRQPERHRSREREGERERERERERRVVVFCWAASATGCYREASRASLVVR
eukprot:COSAG03_NODE_624_length_6664_cov_102.394973_2_plen_293_part_00